MKKYLEKIEHIATRPIGLLAAYWISLTVAALFVLPIILANTDYIDDSARRIGGYYDWGSLGRFVTEALMHLLTFSGNTMADPGVQMQLLAIPVLAFTGWVFACFLGHESKMNLGRITVGALLIVNPYLLTNLSFRFDSLSMILGYALSVVAGVLVVTNVKRYRIAVGVGLLFLAAALYQPMILMFLITSIALLVYRYAAEKGDIFRGILRAGIVFTVAVIFYYGALKVFQFSNIGGDSRGMLVPFNRDGLMMVVANFLAGTKTIALFFMSGAGKVIGVSLGLWVIVALVWLVALKYRAQKWQNSLLTISSPLLITLGIMGPFILMSSALTYQVRTLSTGIGLVLLAGVLVVAMQHLKLRNASVFLALPLVFIFYSLNFSQVYGATLKYQREYDRIVYDEIDDSIVDIKPIQEGGTVYIGGVASSPLSIRALYEKRPLLERMDIAGDNTIWFLWHSLNNMHATKSTIWFVYSKEQQEARSAVCRQANKGLVETNAYFSIYRAESGEHYIWLTDPIVDANNFCN